MFRYLLFCLFLASCQTAPAYALDTCNSYKDIAYEVMLVRQGGEPIEPVLKRTKETLEQHDVRVDVQKNITDIIVKAYKYPYEKNVEKASNLVNEFAKGVYDVCVRAKST